MDEIWMDMDMAEMLNFTISPHLTPSHPISSKLIKSHSSNLRPPVAAAPECPTTQPGRLRPSASSSSPPGAKKHHPVVLKKLCKSGENPMEIIEGSLEVKLPTIWTVEKQR